MIHSSPSPVLTQLPALDDCSIHYDRCILNVSNRLGDGHPLFELMQYSTEVDRIIVPDRAIDDIFRHRSDRAFTFEVGYYGLFAVSMNQIVLGKMVSDHWLIYPVIFELQDKLKSLHSDDNVNIVQGIVPHNKIEPIVRTAVDGKMFALSIKALDIDKDLFAQHLAEEMREVSCLMDKVDFQSTCPPALTIWEWEAVASSDMIEDLQFLCSYMNGLIPERETIINIIPPRAHQGSKIMPLPSLQLSTAGMFSKYRYTKLLAAASEWANAHFNEGHLSANPQDLCRIRRLKPSDPQSRSKAGQVTSRAPMSSHETLRAAARFGPLPQVST